MTPYTPEEIALAREAAASVRPYSHNSALILDGERDGTDIVQSALAAIRATTERAFKLAYAHADMNAGSDDELIQGAEKGAIAIAADLEINEHLKDRPDAK